MAVPAQAQVVFDANVGGQGWIANQPKQHQHHRLAALFLVIQALWNSVERDL